MSATVQTMAQNVGQRVTATGKVGFDLTLIIGIASALFQLLGTCWKNGGVPNSTGTTPQEYLQDHYNTETDEFEEGVYGQVRGQTRRAIRQKHRNGQCPPLNQFSQDDIHEISKSALKEAMSNDKSSAALAEIFN